MTNAFDNLGWNDDFSGAVRLPFAALVIRALRGEAKLKGVTPDARYFGGWAYNADDAKKMVADGDLRTDPSWAVYEADGDKGPYGEAASRVVNVAVIKGRMRWGNDDARQYSTKFFPGARMHVQYLCGLFVRNQGETTFAGMAMITARGHQAGFLQTAIDEYATFIRTATAGTANAKLPRPAWILTLGTFGAEPQFKSVGTGAKSSTITPVKAVLPPSTDALAKRRVPDEVLDELGNKFAQASQWLEAWKQSTQEPLQIAGVAPVADTFEEQPF